MKQRIKDVAYDVVIVDQTWLHKLRGNVGETRMSHYLSGAWSKKYFILLREGDKPKAFYYNKKPKNFLDSQKGALLLNLMFICFSVMTNNSLI